MNEQNEIVLYQPNELTKLEVRVENETVWLNQDQIAQLFGTKRPAITKHLNNIYESGELDKDSTCSILEHMGNDGKQLYKTMVYNLDAILSVGYRVNSLNATMFRRWATSVLKDYMLRGYAINQRLMAMEERIDHRLTQHERILSEHQDKIDFFIRTALPPVEGVFFNGQIFDAYVFAADLIKSAKKRIVLIDNYVDESVLTLLDKRNKGVAAFIYTQTIDKQLRLDIDKHNAQYAKVDVQVSKTFHDRFLIIDDVVYHVGASIKDLGKKLFAFSKMEMPANEILTQI